MLDRVVVSTEDADIASVASEWGAEVPFRRPAVLAEDDARTIDVVNHALEWLEREDAYSPEAVVLLQPTCPFRNAYHIDEAIALWRSSGADLVVGVERARQHPFWAMRIAENGSLTRLLDVDLHKYHQTQLLPPVVFSNSSIYVARRHLVMKHRDFYAGSAVAFVMDQHASLDVDTEWDLHLCDLILGNR
jgi:CMP-N-acetylneuraminic acid synthetase